MAASSLVLLFSSSLYSIYSKWCAGEFYKAEASVSAKKSLLSLAKGQGGGNLDRNANNNSHPIPGKHHGKNSYLFTSMNKTDYVTLCSVVTRVNSPFLLEQCQKKAKCAAWTVTTTRLYGGIVSPSPSHLHDSQWRQHVGPGYLPLPITRLTRVPSLSLRR